MKTSSFFKQKKDLSVETDNYQASTTSHQPVTAARVQAISARAFKSLALSPPDSPKKNRLPALAIKTDDDLESFLSPPAKPVKKKLLEAIAIEEDEDLLLQTASAVSPEWADLYSLVSFQQFEPIKYLFETHGWRLGKKLGRGSFGNVYQLTDQENKEIGAIKLFLNQENGDLARANRFYSYRGDHLTQSIRHPRILPQEVLYWNNHAGRIVRHPNRHCALLAVLMPYLHAQPLESLIQFRTFTLEEIWTVVFSVAEALQALHAQKIVHSDLKADNIMVFLNAASDTEESIKADIQELMLIDFNLATSYENSEQPITPKGSLCSRAPEMVKREVLQEPAKADVFSLGTLMYRLLFRGEHLQRAPDPDFLIEARLVELTEEQIRERLDQLVDPSPSTAITPKMLDQTAKILIDMLQNDPQQRSSIADVLHAMEEIFQQVGKEKDSCFSPLQTPTHETGSFSPLSPPYTLASSSDTSSPSSLVGRVLSRAGSSSMSPTSFTNSPSSFSLLSPHFRQSPRRPSSRGSLSRTSSLNSPVPGTPSFIVPLVPSALSFQPIQTPSPTHEQIEQCEHQEQ